MPKLKENQNSSYRLHKQSGQGIVTLSGKDHLLGEFGTKESRAKYQLLITELRANGRRGDYRNTKGLTIARVLVEFFAHAKTYYSDGDGVPAGEYENFRLAVAPLKELYLATAAEEFGPTRAESCPRGDAQAGLVPHPPP
ncbi:MAG TPA: hypothetical protein VGQ99_22115 [Tepidisphaeraceae bacterium]|jgi:hypothetical protein|nr:hypothetical protein [Tepidisphaeraceae bacterium]